MNTLASLQKTKQPDKNISLKFIKNNYIIFDLVDQNENALQMVGGLSILCHNLSLIPDEHLVYITTRNPIQVQKHLGRYSFIQNKHIAFIHCTDDNKFVDQIYNFTDKSIVIFPSDIILSKKLLYKLYNNEKNNVLVIEKNLRNMVGYPKDCLKIQCNPLENQIIHQLDVKLKTYAGISTGFCKINLNGTSKGNINEFMIDLVYKNKLEYLTTQGLDWVGIKTNESQEYFDQQLVKYGYKSKDDDGNSIYLLGKPAFTQVSPHNGGQWSEFSVNKWRSAVFTTKAYFAQLYDDTQQFIVEMLPNSNANIIEVGCGTGESLVSLTDYAKHCLGLDFNPLFIDFCNKKASKKDNLSFIEMDGTKLVQKLLPKYKGQHNVVTCLGNTVGIMPKEVRDNILVQMGEFVETQGIAIVVYWNGNSFGDAVQNFYHKNPQLCGKFTGANVDFDKCVLETETGYRTHWTTPDEARQEMERLNLEIIRLEEKGKGVLVAFRKKLKLN